MYKLIIRPVLFLFTPEQIHKLVFLVLKIGQSIPGISFFIRVMMKPRTPQLEKELWGIKFPNPVGLAAGLDKDAEVFDMFGNMGFGFVEVGTVTPKPQPGNEKPRLFRLPKDRALINRMGFNNAGVINMVKNLRRKRTKVIVGGNIGKNKNTPNEEALSDYLTCFDVLYPYVDYFVVNVSSPNTPNLRALQDKEPLSKILVSLKNNAKEKGIYKPVLLKIAPDLNDSQLDDIIEIVLSSGIDGIVATNTTIRREGLSYPKEEIDKLGMGGLSGRPLKARSTEVIRYLHEKSQGRIPIMAAGGVLTPEDALEKLQAGASLIQIYTGFIYEGPAFANKINRFLIKNLR